MKRGSLLNGGYARYMLNEDQFVDYSVRFRLPKILDSILNDDENFNAWRKLTQEAIKKDTITVLPMHGDGGPSWEDYSSEYVCKRSDEIDWFYFENYFYRLIMNEIKYFHNKTDPFKQQKVDSIRAGLESFVPISQAEGVDHAEKAATVATLLHRILWGNRNDLSLSGGKVESVSHLADAEDLLADDSSKVAEFIVNETRTLGVILDNCGAELLNDLDFAYFLLEHFDITVTFFAKSHPVFVSDAMICDIEEHIMCLQGAFPGVYNNFKEYINQGRFILRTHDFFTSPLSYWDVPKDLEADLFSHDILLFKGDANYRRLLGDFKIDPCLAVSTALDYWGDQKVVALRTLKAPVLMGMTEEIMNKAAQKSKDWRVEGKFGVIQYKE